MEIQILSPTQAQPLPPVEWNYSEIKAWLESGLERYKGVVYDESQITQAKADRATLNKLVQVFAAKRKEMKQTYLQPYEQFDKEIKELESMVKMQSGEIDSQVKAYENFRKQEKREKIEAEIYPALIGNLAELIPYDRLHDPKWLNVSVSMGSVAEAMAKKVEHITTSLDMIGKMDLPQEVRELGRVEFLKNFDLAAAVLATERIMEQREALARRDAAMRAQKAEETAKVSEPKFTRQEEKNPAEAEQGGDSPEEKLFPVSFRVYVTSAQLKALGDFMRANGIKPERI